MTTNDPSHNLLIVSDLHLSEGFSIHEGKFSRLEDFFSDQPFADFLAHHRDNREEDRPWRLIIAGDLFDFLQVTAVPAATPDKLWAKLMNWQANELSAYNQVSELNKRARLATLNQWMVEIQQTLSQKSAPTFSKLDESLKWLQRKSRKELSGEEVWLLEELVMETWILVNTEKGELTDRTQKYGLGTTWQETVWKLDRIAEGHPVFFQALGQFAAAGNELMIMYGNHDIELCWQQVQTRLCQLLADAADTQAVDVTFLPWIYYEPGLLYLEHGQQYENANAFENILQPTVPGNIHLIEFPPGSMLVRYLFNKIEEAYPFADNLRPINRFFSWAFKNELLKLVTIMIRYIGGFTTFVWTFLKRGWLNYWTNKEERIDINTSLRSFQGLNAEAQSHLTTNFLLQIDKEARDTRQGIFRRMRTVMLLLLVGLLVLVLLAVTVGPFIYLFTSRTDSPFLKIALPLLSALGGIIFKQGIAPWLLSYAAGEHYLETAAKSVAETLKAQNAPAVPYIIFGHNHDPDIVKVISERPLTWYVNTGSWLYSQGVVEDWLQQTKYHSFLKIIPDKIGAAPELRFWNATTKSAERIRMRH